jgi:hypothetical protein
MKQTLQVASPYVCPRGIGYVLICRTAQNSVRAKRADMDSQGRDDCGGTYGVQSAEHQTYKDGCGWRLEGLNAKRNQLAEYWRTGTID